MKYARNVRFQLKDGKREEFNRLFTTDVLPLLKKQNGFNNELTIGKGNDWTAISLWDNRESAEHYDKTVYPEVMRKLTPVIEGTPKMELCEVGMGTIGI